MSAMRTWLRTLHIALHAVLAILIVARFYVAHLDGWPLAIMVPGVLLAAAWLVLGVSYARGNLHRLFEKLVDTKPHRGARERP